MPYIPKVASKERGFMVQRHLGKIKIILLVTWTNVLFSTAADFVMADNRIKLYFEENAQVELIDAKGSRVLIDVHDPGVLSSPPKAMDILLTTHNHGDHRRLDFVKDFPGQQLDIKVGQIQLPGITIRGIASAHNDDDPFKDEGGSNYIFIIDMAGLRIAHFGDIGQVALNPDQLQALGKVDIAITQLANPYSDMNAQNKKGFKLMDQVKPKLIIPTHIMDYGASAKLAAEKWESFESYKRYLSLSTDNLPTMTTIIFMGRNADLIKLPYSDL